MKSLFVSKSLKSMLYVAIILVLAIGFAACSSGSGKNNQQSSQNTADTTNFRPDTINVKVTQVQPKDFTQTLHATGTLNARQEATVRAKVSGEIEHVYVDIGDQVKKGDKLMKIQAIDFKLKLQQAKAQLAKAKATLENSKKEMKRVKGLYKAGSATSQKKDQAVTSYRQAQADYKQNKAAKNTAQQQLDYTTIKAPFSGVVTERNYKRGDYASVGQPAAQVTDLSVMEANMDIPERYAGSLEKGLPVTLHFQSQLQPVKGKVTAVNPKIDTDTRTFLVKVTVQNSDRKLPAGLFFKADFALPEMKDQPAVPAEAVQKSRGQDILWVIKHGEAHRQVVQTGPQNGGWVMIRQGVQMGETVAVGGVGSLIDGYPVTTREVDSLESE
jgi:membrane fusion protein (multidrug efflux system)